MKKSYYSNGKLLLTGEYVVLDGAKSLAIPTKFGQFLHVEENNSETINWTSFDADKSIWFESEISFDAIIQKQHFENEKVKSTLIEILNFCYQKKPQFFAKNKGYQITTELTFPKNWGLGTSSTLINNIAQWFAIDAFDLLFSSFGGSGYDIACAQNDFPILYQLNNKVPIVEKVDFYPNFLDKIYFVYLNQKQNSRDAITSYRQHSGNVAKIITKIDALTNQILTAIEPKTFANAIGEHEIEMSNLLELQTVKEKYFNDFDGVIKSLGAWGGDFVLAISKENPIAYFNNKGYHTIISYKDMIH